MGGRCTVTWLSNFLQWVDLLNSGAPPTRARKRLREKGKSAKSRKEKKKKRKKERQKAHKLDCQDASSHLSASCLIASRAWNFTTQPRKQNTRHVRSLNNMSGTITRPTVWKRNTSHTISNEKKKKKKKKKKDSDVNRANIFCRKKIMQKRVWPSKSSFLHKWTTFLM